MSLSSKKKNTAPEEPYLTPTAKVYFEYKMGLPEKILVYLIGFAIGALIGYVFYKIVAVAIIFGVIAGFIVIPIRRQQAVDKQINTLKKQFQTMLSSISTSLISGGTVTNGFVDALTDMRRLYGAKADIVKELEIIYGNLGNNDIQIEDVLTDLARRSGIEDIRTFADVFAACKKRGGDMKEVVSNTYNVLNDKIEIEMEIATMITSSKSELLVMCFMPVIMRLVLDSMGGELSGAGTPAGYISTTIALVMFVAAFFIGRKLLKIKV